MGIDLVIFSPTPMRIRIEFSFISFGAYLDMSC